IDGGTMLGWFNVGGRLGTDPGPEGDARFIAAPPPASGTEAGGTGGGRSENIWAETGPELRVASIAASNSTGKSRRAACPHPPMPLPLEIIAMLFTENAANSSLLSGSRGQRLGTATNTRS
ncbi:MAG TPA: hypothetical protein VE267_02245, partial [Bradyrhizobium sp.]|nr:hypothetical protein [Bradyrhizobium sp.]